MLLLFPSLILIFFPLSVQAILDIFRDKDGKPYKSYFPPKMETGPEEPQDSDWQKRTFHLDTWARRIALDVANRFENEALRPSVYLEERKRILNSIWPSARIFTLDVFTDRLPLSNDNEFYFIKSSYNFINGSVNLFTSHNANTFVEKFSWETDDQLGAITVPSKIYFISVGSALEMRMDDRHVRLPFWARPEAIGFSRTSEASKEIQKIIESFDETTLKENIEFVERYLVPIKDEVKEFLQTNPGPKLPAREVRFQEIIVPPPETPNYHPGKVVTKDGTPWIAPLMFYVIYECILSTLARQKNVSSERLQKIAHMLWQKYYPKCENTRWKILPGVLPIHLRIKAFHYFRRLEAVLLYKDDPQMPSVPHYFERDGLFLGVGNKKSLQFIFFDNDKPDVNPKDISFIRAMSFRAILRTHKELANTPFTWIRLQRTIAGIVKNSIKDAPTKLV